MAKAKRYWLAKSEPDVYSIQDLERDGQTSWEGVRNYQARIHLRAMSLGDLVLFYHSNAEPSGVAGVARVIKTAYPDRSALDRSSPYYDEGATEEDPRWSMVDVAFEEKLPAVLSLAALKAAPGLEGMEVIRKGSRLSVSEVSPAHFALVLKLAKGAAKAPPSPDPRPSPRPRPARGAPSARGARKPAARGSRGRPPRPR